MACRFDLVAIMMYSYAQVAPAGGRISERTFTMHMANELLTPAVAAGTFAVAAGAVGVVCHKAKSLVNSDKFALMGIMGAFVFAAQMVNFPLPFLPGTSGHIVGAVLLAVLLGPWLAAIVLTAVVMIQCLIFQDGGLLALGCNIINLALVPTFLGYWLYRVVYGLAGTPPGGSTFAMYAAAVVASTGSLIVGATLVVAETWLSGVLVVPAATFLATMVGVHIVIGLIEGVITAAVLIYLRRIYPAIVLEGAGDVSPSRRRLIYAGLLAASLVIGAGLSLLASEKPDGLEWSYAERPENPEFEPMVANDNTVIARADAFHGRYALLPDYSIRAGDGNDDPQAGWTSFAGVAGASLTMGILWLSGWVLSKRNGTFHAPRAD